MRRFLNVIGFVAALVLFPVVASGQATCLPGNQKYVIGGEPMTETIGQSCEQWSENNGDILVGIYSRFRYQGSSEVPSGIKFTCFVENEPSPPTPITGYAACETSPGNWENKLCEAQNDCDCSKNSSCCGGGAGGGGGGSRVPPGASSGPTRNPGELFAADPVSIPQGYNLQVNVDWSSPKDERFQFSRTYKSGGYSQLSFLLGGANPGWATGFGLGWSGNWAYKVTDIIGASSDHVVLAPQGKQYRYNGSGVATPTRTDEAYEFITPGIGNPNQYLWKDGKGTTYVFTDDATGLSKLEEITWPDGYKLTFTHDVDGNLEAIQDNRSQRAEFTWVNDIDPDMEIYVIKKIEVDTAYDGATFNPDVRIRYTNTYETGWYSGLITTDAKVVDIATGNGVVQHVGYEYALTDISTVLPRLTGISDFRLNSSGQTYNYTTFEYETTFDSLIQSYRVKSASHQNSAGNFQFQTPNGSPPTGNVTVTNPLGKDSDYAFAWVGDSLRPTQIDGVATPYCLATTKTLGYDPNVIPGGLAPIGYIYERTLRNGSITTYKRDGRGLLEKKTEDTGGLNERVTDYLWDSAYRLPASRKTSEMEEIFAYDANGLLTDYEQKDVLFGSPTNGQVRAWAYVYTELMPSGLKVLTSVDGPLPGGGDVTSYTYNPDGTLDTMTDPNGLITMYQNYDAFGNAARIVLPDGVAWKLTYDARGLITQTVENVDVGTDNTTDYVYDIARQLTSYTDGLGNTWTFTYDEARRLTDIENPDGEIMNLNYDTMGNVIRTEYLTTLASIEFFEDNTFDKLGRLRTAAGANNQITTIGYDEEDNPIDITDSKSKTTVNSFDALNRLYQIVDRQSGVTAMTHNDADQVTQYTDQRSIVTGYTHNGFGEVILENSADRGMITYTYDERGLVASMTDGRSITSNYGYDDGGRITSRTFPALPNGDPSPENQTFTYDYTGGGSEGEGKIRSIIDESGRINRKYANGGYISRERRIIEGQTYDVNYKFDTYGRLSWVLTPGKLRIRYFYDDQDRIKKITAQRRIIDPATGQFPPAQNVVRNVAYKPFGPRSSLKYGDDFILTLGYDQSYRLTSQKDELGATVLRDLTLGWSNRDDPKSVTDNLVAANSEVFIYNNRQFLRRATGPYDELNFKYDAVGNRTEREVDDGSIILTDTYNYPPTSNRLQSTAGGDNALFYDASGNVILENKNGQDYEYYYNAANRMESISVSQLLSASYVYNALGQQVSRLLQATLGLSIHVVHDIDGNRLAEYTVEIATGNSTLLREYIWLDGEAIGVVDNGTLYFVRTDHIGRPVFATDGNIGNGKVWTASYLPFGEVETSTGNPIELRFPGQWFQSESGLHQNWMREYDPTTGRYLQADPLGLVDGPSVYGYALQNPGRYVDPRGEQSSGLMSTAIGTAGVLALADGPIPLGDIAGLCVIGAAVVYCAINENACSIKMEQENCFLIDEGVTLEGGLNCIYECPTAGIISIPSDTGHCPMFPDVPVFK